MALRPTARTDVNRSAILAHLGAHGPASRADLARALNVSPALMTALTKDLIADGLLQELEHSPSQGGRPARMLGLVSSAGRAIGVKVVADHVAFVEVGIDGTVRRSASEPFDASASTMLADLTEPAPPFHRRRVERAAARHRRGRARQRRQPGQRSRGLRATRLVAGADRRDAASRVRVFPCSSRTTSTPSRSPSGSTASVASYDNFLVRHDRNGCRRGHRRRRRRAARLRGRRWRDRAHPGRRRRPGVQLRQHRLPRVVHRRGGAGAHRPANAG